MFFSYNGVSVFYKRHFGPGTPVVLLHGWGGSNVSFLGTYEYLCGANRDVIAIDFPGFGASDTPPSDWGIFDNADCVEALVNELRIRKVILVGHSFGGRVAICLGGRDWVESIVLVDSAGVKPRFSLVKAFNVWRYKAAKRAGKDLSSFGSTDYLALEEDMKPVFVRVVNTHLNDKLKDIKCPTLIIWGNKDRETPPYMARYLRRKIEDSTLIYLSGGHYAYVDNFFKFNLILSEFTKGGKECLSRKF